MEQFKFHIVQWKISVFVKIVFQIQHFRCSVFRRFPFNEYLLDRILANPGYYWWFIHCGFVWQLHFSIWNCYNDNSLQLLNDHMTNMSKLCLPFPGWVTMYSNSMIHVLFVTGSLYFHVASTILVRTMTIKKDRSWDDFCLLNMLLIIK